jgi:putative acetyltransferase
MPDAAPLLRPETSTDHLAIACVVEAAFGQHDEVAIVDRIRASDRYEPDLALVAELDGAVIGHAMLSWCELAHADGSMTRFLQLAPVAVLPEHHAQGIGGALCRELLARAAARDEPIVGVLGHPTYYPRFGFEPGAARGIQPPDPAMEPAFFVAVLDPVRASTLRGTVVFSPALGGPAATPSGAA